MNEAISVFGLLALLILIAVVAVQFTKKQELKIAHNIEDEIVAEWEELKKFSSEVNQYHADGTKFLMRVRNQSCMRSLSDSYRGMSSMKAKMTKQSIEQALEYIDTECKRLETRIKKVHPSFRRHFRKIPDGETTIL